MAGENLSLVDTFKAADEVLLNAVQGISDLINNTGLINADFADVSTVMTNKGLALMGTGTSTGPERALKAAKQAISSPLLEDVSIDGATGIIINITGNSSLTTHETNQAVTLIMEAADEDAEIIFGTVIDDSMGENVKVTVIATGLQVARKEAVNFNNRQPQNYQPAQNFTAEVNRPEPQIVQPIAAPINPNPPRVEVRPEPRYEAPVAKNTDYAVKSEMTFDFDEPSLNLNENGNTQAQKPKINWAEKLQNAANKYESQKNFEPNTTNTNRAGLNQTQYETRAEFNHVDNSAPVELKNDNGNQNRESRIKSIAEKLGFFNFDEDEFDTPSFMKKNDRNHDSQI